MRSSLVLILAILLLNISHVFSQDKDKEIHIKKTSVAVKIDGILDDEVWKSADLATGFFQNAPFDTSFAKNQTEVRLTFDDKFLYVAMKAYQPKNAYTVSSLKRDFESGSSDVFSVTIDAFKDKLNGMQFSVSPLNSQREGLISLGTQADFSWDNKWFSKVKNYEEYWTVEFAIPFTTLRYKVSSGNNSWRINFGRFFMQTNESATWSPVPRNFKPNNLAFTGLLIWDDAPPKPGANISLIPYLSTNYSKDFPRNENLEALKPDGRTKLGAGMDAKIAITPSLNLDLTVNPDFSQVEVDAQQTNLSRFELFFPEKRQFFIENSDLFGTFGFPSSRPFFSRRIGLTRNKFTGLVEQVPILGGARLSGKLNENWRIGVMNMQTGKLNLADNEVSPATNFSVGVVQRKVFSRSFIGAIVVNKENIFKNLPETSTEGITKYNRMAGLEFNYYSPDNRLETETSYHQSFSPGAGKDASMINQYIGYHHPHLDVNLGMARLGKDYITEVGYTPRPGVYTLYRPVTIIFNPKNQNIAKKINSFGLGIDGSDVFDLEGKRLDTESPVFFYISTPSEGQLTTGYYMAYTRLQSPFDITNASDNPNPDFSKNVVPLPVDIYKTRNYFVEITSPKRFNFFGNFLIYAGNNFRSEKINEGKVLGIESTFNYRIQPYGKVAMDVYYTDIKMQKPYNSVKYWLIGPKAEMSFSKSVFLSTYFQYNSQTNNTNINSRLQWRFKPVSDIFLVYTDNYFAEQIPRFGIQPWTPKNRALILKMTYWLNV